MAVFAPDDGLSVIRRLVPAAAGARFIALEVGETQAARSRRLVREGGFADTSSASAIWPGIERVVVGRR